MKKGFTLIELLVVLFIVSLASVWVIPRIAQPLGGVEVKTTAKHVLSSFRYARNLAVSQKIRIIAHFDSKRNRLIMVKEVRESFGPWTDFPAPQQGGQDRYEVLDTYDFPKSLKIDQVGAIQPKNVDGYFQVRFYPSGRSSGGQVIFSGNTKKQFMVNVDFITGMARLSGMG